MFRLWLSVSLLTACFTLVFPNVTRAAQFSSMVIDATTGRTLHQYRANQQRYPASLTKMMTLYMMFEEIEAGRMKPNTKIRISRNAARQPSSKLGLRYRSSISARDAMHALIVKSANDVATAMAEHIAGSEAKFSRRMTGKARQLGLYNTRFTNASGLYHWRQQIRGSGAAVPNSNTSSEQWSAQTKLAIVAETYSMTESELSQYCREKGLFPEQIQSWRSECMQGFKSSKEQEAEAKKQAKADKLEIKDLKKDLRLKEKALAETAALLVLRKNLRAFYGEEDEVD